MRNSRKTALFLAFAMVWQSLSGMAVPERAQAAEAFSWNGWEYEVNGTVAAITGYTGEETEIVFPTSVPSREDDSSQRIPAVEIKESAFDGNTEITSVRIPDGYAVIGAEAFYKCTSLQRVELPSTVSSWPTHSKYNSSVMQTITYQQAFAYCTSLREVVIPEGASSLGMEAFAFSDALEEVEIPSTMAQWEYAFCRAGGLKRVKIGDGVKSVPRSAFQKCSSLEEVEIPDSVELIDYYAFEMTAMMDLTLPKNLRECNSDIIWGHDPKYPLHSDDRIEKEKLGTLEIHSSTYVPTKYTDRWETIRVPRYSQSEIALADHPGMEYLPGPDVSSVSIEPYQQEYDGKAHPAVTVSGMQEGDKVSYGTTGYDAFTPEVPELTEPESRKIWVRIEREGYYSPYQIQVTASVLDSRPAVVRELKKEAGKADALSGTKEKYTAESWEAYEAAAAEAKALLEKETAVVQELSDALEQLQAARQNLVLLTEDPGNPPPGGTGSPPPGSTGSPTPGGPGSPAPGSTGSPSPGGTDNPPPGSTGSPPPGGTDNPAPGSTGSPSPGGSDSPPPGSTGSPSPGGSDNPPLGSTGNPPPGSSALPSPTQTPGGSDEDKKPVVAKAVIAKAAASGKRTLDIRWKKASGAQGYQITLGTDREMKKNKKAVTVKGAATLRTKVKKLKSGKTYFVKVRGWCIRDGKKVYGAWSSTKKVKVK